MKSRKKMQWKKPMYCRHADLVSLTWNSVNLTIFFTRVVVLVTRDLLDILSCSTAQGNSTFCRVAVHLSSGCSQIILHNSASNHCVLVFLVCAAVMCVHDASPWFISFPSQSAWHFNSKFLFWVDTNVLEQPGVNWAIWGEGVNTAN